MMIYYRDTNGVYYYLEKYGQNMYDDKIVEPVKDPSDEAGASGTRLLFTLLNFNIHIYSIKF